MTLLFNILGWNAEFIQKVHIFIYNLQSLQERKAIAYSLSIHTTWYQLIVIPHSRSDFNLSHAYFKSIWPISVASFSNVSIVLVNSTALVEQVTSCGLFTGFDTTDNHNSKV